MVEHDEPQLLAPTQALPSRLQVTSVLIAGCRWDLLMSSLSHRIRFASLSVLFWSEWVLGNVMLYKISIGWPKTRLQRPLPHCRWSALALLPLAATGSGGPPPRPPPSKREDTWSVMASCTDICRRGWVGQDCSKTMRWNFVEMLSG